MGSDDLGASVSFTLPIYIIAYAATGAVLVGHIVQMVRVRREKRPSASMNQHYQVGLKRDAFGACLRYFSLLYVLYLNLIMLLTCIGQYTDHWLLGGATTDVVYNSYTAIMLLAWTALAACLGLAKYFSHSLATFYLKFTRDLRSADFVKSEHGLYPVRQGIHSAFDDVIVIEDTEKGVLHKETLSDVFGNCVRYIDLGLSRFVFSPEREAFVKPSIWQGEANPTLIEVKSVCQAGLSLEVVQQRQVIFGPNQIDVRVPSVIAGIIHEFNSVFYIYQFFAIWIPAYWDYVTLALLQAVLVSFSGLIKVLFERRRKQELQKLVSQKTLVQAMRNGALTEIDSHDLVPGDVVVLRPGKVSFDGLILCGTSVTVDEALLTGETVPEVKFAVGAVFPSEDDDLILARRKADVRKCSVFAGTLVIEHSQDVLILVTHTGGGTLRGELLSGEGSAVVGLLDEQRRSIWMLLVMAVLVLGAVYWKYPHDLGGVLAGINNVTVLINPLLPVAVVGGQLTSSSRLRKKHIFVRDVARLTALGEGMVDTVLFDKTHTLTEERIDLVEWRSTVHRDGRSSDDMLKLVMACCHSVKQDAHGNLTGSALEVAMVKEVKKLGWTFGGGKIVSPAGEEFQVRAVFPFTHESACMRVTVEGGGSVRQLVKGSWPAVRAKVDSKVDRWEAEIEQLSQEGKYVLAVCSAKEGKRMKMDGLLVFENPVKSEAKAVVEVLVNKMGLQVGILTGDDERTARAVAKSLGLVNEKLVHGRMSPEDKTAVVDELQRAGRKVVMVGDGGNDSGALRQATGGLAIGGRAEASVSASFSTDRHDLWSVIQLLDEARRSEATSRWTFRYLVMAGLMNTFGQTWNLIMAGGFLSSLGFIWVDMVTIPLVMWSLCFAEAKKVPRFSPVKKRRGLLVYLWSLLSLGGTLIALWYAMRQDKSWFVEFNSDADISDWDARGNNFESELVFVWLAWTLVDLGVCYRHGSLWRNWRLLTVASSLYGFVVLLVVSQSGALGCIFKVNCDSTDFASIQTSWINHLLFSYDQVGGVWDGVVDSTEWPTYWKVCVLASFVVMSALHQGGKALLH